MALAPAFEAASVIAGGAEEDGARAAIYREEVQPEIWHQGNTPCFSSQSK